MARKRRHSKASKTNGPWNSRPQLTARLVVLYETTKHSARQIAEILGDEFGLKITRGQVIGKSGRLGLAPRIISSSPYARLPKPPKPKPVVVPVVVIPAPARPPSIQVDRSQLRVASLPIVRQGAELCRWLYDDYPFACCSEPKLEGSSYCIWHDRKVHIPATQYVPMRRRL
jgi:hypothetical protein